MIVRYYYQKKVQQALRRSPIVALLGPRQCGKTTLAREFVDEKSDHYFDLENPLSSGLLDEPMTHLQDLEGCIVIDEIQRKPELFPVLRVLADRKKRKTQFLILGSAAPDVSRQAAESLAGRVEIIEMNGFDRSEVPEKYQSSHWMRGGFPRSLLARSEEESRVWRKNFIQTYLERDLSMLGFGLSPALMGRFWMMLSHYHGQIWNAAEMAASMGIAPNTAKNYLDILEHAYLIRRLMPWYVNLGKRLVKSPKIYFRDSGLFHSLQGVNSQRELMVHPKLGASWEGYLLEKVIFEIQPDQVYYYAVHAGSELDLFLIKNGEKIGIEFKRIDVPQVTKSMRIAIDDLKLDQLKVVYPGERRYYLEDKIEVIPYQETIL